MLVDKGVWHRTVQLRHAPGHGSRIPVLQHPAGDQPHVVVFIRNFCWRLVGQGEDIGLAVFPAVEADFLSLLNVRVVFLPVPPQGFLAVNNRPTEPALIVIAIEVCKVMSLATSKRSIFFEQAFLDVEAEVLGLVVIKSFGCLIFRESINLAVPEENIVQGLTFVFWHFGNHFSRPDFFDCEALGELHQLPEIRFCLAGGLNLLPPELGAAFSVAIGALFFHPHGGR